MALAADLYVETFDDGPGGWFGWWDNARGPKPLPIRDGCAVSGSPWWIDYNHAPPGAGYLHLLYILMTRGPLSEHYRETGGPNRFIEKGFSADFTGARITLRLRGELETRGARMLFLVQGTHEGICSGWLLTGEPIEVAPEWSEVTVAAVPDEEQWTCLGSRHDLTDSYGHIPLATVLGDVNCDILFVLHPLDIAPMGPLEGHPHILRPEKDYAVWRSRLPEGYVLLDEVRIGFAR